MHRPHRAGAAALLAWRSPRRPPHSRRSESRERSKGWSDRRPVAPNTQPDGADARRDGSGTGGSSGRRPLRQAGVGRPAERVEPVTLQAKGHP